MISAVTCHQVRKTFGSGDTVIEVLRGVEFSAHLGEMTFLVGPSGCGKTTLISVIAGLLNASAGEVSLFGIHLPELGSREQILFRRKTRGLSSSNTI